MEAYFPFSFDGQIIHYDVGSETYAYTVVMVPQAVTDELPLKEYPRLRVVGEFNDLPFESALTPARGGWYLLLSKKMLSAIGATVGDEVQVRFKIADQEAVSVPPALQAALAENDNLRVLWDAATAGKKRGLAYRVSTAKTAKTQAKRIDEVLGILEGRLDMRGKPVQ